MKEIIQSVLTTIFVVGGVVLVIAGILSFIGGISYITNWGEEQQQTRYFKCMEKREQYLQYHMDIECGKMFYKYQLDLDKQ